MTALNWQQVLGKEKQEQYFHNLLAFVHHERMAQKVIYPSRENVFHAFRCTRFHELKVVIVGQDPYHGPQQAHGLCFSVPHGIVQPPSLRNIYLELANNISNFKRPISGCLEHWAAQGVLLLNSVLTVEAGKAHSHANIGWERFTNRVIDVINQYLHGVVFLLWGGYAQQKGMLIDKQRHYVLQAAHPSPLSAYRGFFNCQHFSRTNELLLAQHKQPIAW